MNKFVWASALGLAMLLSFTTRASAQDPKPCDCNGNDEVVINELISSVNILLGNAALSTCAAADVNGSGDVGVNELVQCVNCANGNCGGSTGGPKCGDNTTDTGEECDDGNNFGGDGCAANCTTEQARVGTFDSAKTIATVQTEAFPVVINLTGSQTFQVGKPRDTAVVNAAGEQIYKADELPVVIRAADLHFDPVRVTGLVCACVRGVEVESFGPGVSATGSVGCSAGVLSDISYSLKQDHNTNPPGDDPTQGNRIGPPVGTADDPQCDDTTTLPGGTISTACKEGTGEKCLNTPGETETHPHIGVCNGPRVLVRSGGPAPAGSVFLLNNTAIGLLQDRGTCKPNARLPNGTCEFADYGPDCMPCTDDDTEKGNAENIPTTTGTAEASVIDANNSESVQGVPNGTVLISKDGDCLGPCTTVVTGSPFDCDKIVNDPNGLAGGSLAVAFPSIDAATIGDNVTTTTFFNAD